jgi:hypothetical protein
MTTPTPARLARVVAIAMLLLVTVVVSLGPFVSAASGSSTATATTQVLVAGNVAGEPCATAHASDVTGAGANRGCVRVGHARTTTLTIPTGASGARTTAANAAFRETSGVRCESSCAARRSLAELQMWRR